MPLSGFFRDYLKEAKKQKSGGKEEAPVTHCGAWLSDVAFLHLLQTPGGCWSAPLDPPPAAHEVRLADAHHLLHLPARPPALAPPHTAGLASIELTWKWGRGQRPQKGEGL